MTHQWFKAQSNGHEFAQTPGDGEGQGSLACCSPWGHRSQRVRHDLATKQQQNLFRTFGSRAADSNAPRAMQVM